MIVLITYNIIFIQYQLIFTSLKLTELTVLHLVTELSSLKAGTRLTFLTSCLHQVNFGHATHNGGEPADHVQNCQLSLTTTTHHWNARAGI